MSANPNSPGPDEPVTAPSATTESSGWAASMRSALVKYFRRKTGSAVEAEDLAQDVLVRVLGHGSWGTAEQARGYIFRAAVNRWRDRRRRQGVRGTTVVWDEESLEAAGAGGEENGPECVLMVREELQRTLAALSEMNERTRMVLILVRLEQLRAATVADMLGISMSAVNKHLAKGLAHLAQVRRQQDGEG